MTPEERRESYLSLIRVGLKRGQPLRKELVRLLDASGLDHRTAALNLLALVVACVRAQDMPEGALVKMAVVLYRGLQPTEEN